MAGETGRELHPEEGLIDRRGQAVGLVCGEMRNFLKYVAIEVVSQTGSDGCLPGTFMLPLESGIQALAAFGVWKN